MPITYRDAGVDVEAGNELVRKLKNTLSEHRPPELLGELGGFAALVRVPKDYRNPILATSTDGVGTKLDLLIQHNRLETVGFDLVGMCANDVLSHGAKPHLFLDYFATGKLDVAQAETVVNSIAEACAVAGCSLVGGETAEMPGFYPAGKFDLAGFCIGWVEQDQILHANRVQEGDLIIGLGSTGPHSNGFALIRSLLEQHPNTGAAIVDALLHPTAIYVASLLPHLAQIHALTHITGGGFKDNVPRSLSQGLEAHIELTTWKPPPVFEWLQKKGPIADTEMFSTFNCGIGMLAFLEESNAETLMSELPLGGTQAYVIGSVQRAAQPARESELVIGNDRFEFGPS